MAISTKEEKVYNLNADSEMNDQEKKGPSVKESNLETAPIQYHVHYAEANDSVDAESKIQYYLESYRNYISLCINPEDFLFYEYFDIEKRKYFRKLSRSSKDTIHVVSRMIDTIIAMNDVQGRFSALVKLFEDEFENEKISKILKGEKMPTNRRENKEKIQKVCSAEICKNLNVIEIIPHLVGEKLISNNEGIELRNTAEKQNPVSAAIDLLYILPHRHPNWYTRFLTCLVKSGHIDLAKTVDEELCTKIIQDQSSRNQVGEGKIDYRDDLISLVTGSNDMRQHNRKRYDIRSMTSTTVSVEQQTDFVREKTVQINTIVSTKRSPEHERAAVAEWVIASQDMEEKSESEQNFDVKIRKKIKISRQGETAKRPRSLYDKIPLRKKNSKRHQTLQVPIDQMAIMQKYLLKAPSNESIIFQRYDDSQESQKYGSDWSCRAPSMIGSSVDSLDSLCVDKTWDLTMSVNDNDHSCINIEITNMLKKISDLNQECSIADEKVKSNAKPKVCYDEDGQECSNTGEQEEEESNAENTVEAISTMDGAANADNVCQRIDRAIQTEAKTRVSNCPTFQQLLTMSFIHPVKISLVVKNNPDIPHICTILDWMSHRTIELEDYTLSFKAHYVSTLIKKAETADDLDIWVDNLLCARECDGYFEDQDVLIREVLDKYEYKSTWIFKTIFSEIQQIDKGDGLSSLGILSKLLRENSVSVDDKETISRHENATEKKDYGCCRSETTAGGCSNNAKVKKQIVNTNITNVNVLKENDQVTDMSITSNYQTCDTNTVTTEEEGCNTCDRKTSKQSLCKFCIDSLTINRERIYANNADLDIKHETIQAPIGNVKMKIQHFNACNITMKEENHHCGPEVGCDQTFTNDTNVISCKCFSEDELSSLSESGVSLEAMSQDSPDYKCIAELRFKRCGVTIICIHKISNQTLLSRFTHQKELIEEQNGNANVRQLFHGSRYLKEVIKGVFDATKHEPSGLSFSSNPLLFDPGSRNIDLNLDIDCSEGNSCGRSVLLCSVCLGKTKNVTETCSSGTFDIRKSKEFHSWRMAVNLNNVNYLKYKILNGDQVYPEYLVTYETNNI